MKTKTFIVVLLATCIMSSCTVQEGCFRTYKAKKVNISRDYSFRINRYRPIYDGFL